MKQDNSIETAEYCKMKDLLVEPAIAWWANHVLKKKKQIISKVKSRSKKKSHKYGIEMKLVAHTLEIDRKTGTDFWKKALEKEMKNVRAAFNTLDKDHTMKPGRTFLECYMVFDVMMDFTRNA